MSMHIGFYKRLGILCGTGILLGGCDETVVRRYSTRVDAVADQLFEKVWLPDIIPLSSRDILTENDLDLNMSEGEFYFTPADAEKFAGQLKTLDSRRRIPWDWQWRVKTEGYAAYHFQEWTFLINASKGHCLYQMQLAEGL